MGQYVIDTGILSLRQDFHRVPRIDRYVETPEFQPRHKLGNLFRLVERLAAQYRHAVVFGAIRHDLVDYRGDRNQRSVLPFVRLRNETSSYLQCEEGRRKLFQVFSRLEQAEPKARLVPNAASVSV